MATVELCAVTKRFDRVVAVDNVSLTVREGEFFSLLGPSGCGKTTTLRMIGGFEQPTEGRIELQGEDVTWLPPYRRNVNTVFQNYALFPHLSVYDNIAFGLRRRRVPEREVRGRVTEMLRLVELPAPAPARGEVAIAVEYAPVNWGDTQKRAGTYPDPVPYPVVLGMEVAGIVAAVGSGVRDLRPGDRVAALCGPRLLGGYAELVVVPRPYVLRIPAAASLREAAAVPLAALTAYHLLRSAYRLRRGETVLVHAAAGSVGQAVCQVASTIGARVIGTVGRAEKIPAARAAGATVVVDRSREDFVAAALAATEVRARALAVGAHLLEVAPEDAEWAGGRVRVRGAPERSVALAEIAAAAHDGRGLPPGDPPGLSAEVTFTLPGPVFPFGAYAARVAVDPETGEVEVREVVAVDDAGRVVNPLLAEGQVVGAAVQGLGEALTEEAVYDDEGQLLTGSLAQYGVLSAAEVPPIETELQETPSPHDPLGAKGIGEAGAIGTPAAVANAVLDALAPLGVRHLDLPFTPERVLAAIRAAR